MLLAGTRIAASISRLSRKPDPTRTVAHAGTEDSTPGSHSRSHGLRAHDRIGDATNVPITAGASVLPRRHSPRPGPRSAIGDKRGCRAGLTGARCRSGASTRERGLHPVRDARLAPSVSERARAGG